MVEKLTEQSEVVQTLREQPANGIIIQDTPSQQVWLSAKLFMAIKKKRLEPDWKIKKKNINEFNVGDFSNSYGMCFLHFVEHHLFLDDTEDQSSNIRSEKNEDHKWGLRSAKAAKKTTNDSPSNSAGTTNELDDDDDDEVEGPLGKPWNTHISFGMSSKALQFVLQ